MSLSGNIWNRNNLLLVLMLSVGGLVVLSAPVGAGDTMVHTADAQTTKFLHCWAWADSAGWISLNSDYATYDCPTTSSVTSSVPYSVGFSASGALCGHAWSDQLGWLSFNRTETGNPPPGPEFPPDPGGGAFGAPIARLVITPTGTSTVGWARFLSACDSVPCPTSGPGTNNKGGWDGWVSLSGTGYGVTFEDLNGDGKAHELTGYAWGGDAPAGGGNVVSWISFSGTSPDYGVTSDEPAFGPPTFNVTQTTPDFEVKFVADRPATTTVISVDASTDSINSPLFSFELIDETVSDGRNTSSVSLRRKQVVPGSTNRQELSLLLTKALATGVYPITIRTTVVGTDILGLPVTVQANEVRRLKVTNIIPGFGER